MAWVLLQFKRMKLVIAVLGLGLVLGGTGCSKKTASKPVDIDNNSSGNPVTAPVDYLGAVNKARKSAMKDIDLAYMKNAIQQFNGMEDRYPKDLNELVQKHYIQEVPTLPSGQRLIYNPANGDLRVVRQAPSTNAP